jgi:hypothetical protein
MVFLGWPTTYLIEHLKLYENIPLWHSRSSLLACEAGSTKGEMVRTPSGRSVHGQPKTVRRMKSLLDEGLRGVLMRDKAHEVLRNECPTSCPRTATGRPKPISASVQVPNTAQGG